MPQNSSRNSTNRPLRVDKRYKETPKVPKTLHLPTPLKHLKTSSQPLFSQSSHYHTNMYATTTVGPHLIPLAPTPSPSPTLVTSPDASLIPLPPSDTRTVTSTRVASPEYMPRTPSPVEYWMPEDKDIESDNSAAAEHAASPMTLAGQEPSASTDVQTPADPPHSQYALQQPDCRKRECTHQLYRLPSGLDQPNLCHHRLNPHPYQP
jgi:hypothetical protein